VLSNRVISLAAFSPKGWHNLAWGIAPGPDHILLSTLKGWDNEEAYVTSVPRPNFSYQTSRELSHPFRVHGSLAGGPGAMPLARLCDCFAVKTNGTLE
jgi:hypothetical protein